MTSRCSCLTCREFGAFYTNRVLFLVTREGEELHVGVDELTEGELAEFTARGTDAEKAEIVDWLAEPSPTPEVMQTVPIAHGETSAHAA